MKSCRLVGVFLFLFSQMSWAGLITLKGDGVTAYNFPSSSFSPITFVTSFLVDTDTADSNADTDQGLFLNAIKSGSLEFNNGHKYDLDMSVPDVGNVSTRTINADANVYAMGALNLYLKFVDSLGDMLTLGFSSHTNLGNKDAGFVNAGSSLQGLQNSLSFEGHGQMCISNCNTVYDINTDFHTVPVAAVPEPQPLMLLLLGILGIVFKRFKNNFSRISN